MGIFQSDRTARSIIRFVLDRDVFANTPSRALCLSRTSSLHSLGLGVPHIRPRFRPSARYPQNPSEDARDVLLQGRRAELGKRASLSQCRLLPELGTARVDIHSSLIFPSVFLVASLFPRPASRIPRSESFKSFAAIPPFPFPGYGSSSGDTLPPSMEEILFDEKLPQVLPLRPTRHRVTTAWLSAGLQSSPRVEAGRRATDGE